MRKKGVIILTTLIVIVACVLAYAKVIGLHVTVLNRNEMSIENNLQNKLKNDEYPMVYEYSVIRLKNADIVFYKSGVHSKLPNVYKGSESQVFQKCFNYCLNFKYNQDNPNPNLLKDEGGNCQALSIMFKELCEKNGLECKIILTEDHAYNEVILKNGDAYEVDITNKSIKEIGGREDEES